MAPDNLLQFHLLIADWSNAKLAELEFILIRGIGRATRAGKPNDVQAIRDALSALYTFVDSRSESPTN